MPKSSMLEDQRIGISQLLIPNPNSCGHSRHYPVPYPAYHPSTELPMEGETAQRSRASFRLTAGPQTARDH